MAKNHGRARAGRVTSNRPPIRRRPYAERGLIMLMMIGTVGERGIDPRPDSALRNLLIDMEDGSLWTQWAPGYSCDEYDSTRFCILTYNKPEPYEEN